MKPTLAPRYLALSLGCLSLASACLAQTTNWVQAFPKTNPGARWTHGMAYDLIRSRTVLFGGTVTGGSNYANDTWEYNGTNWVKMSPQNSPKGRRVHSMVYHTASLKTVLFGGLDSTGTRLGDTWEYDGKTWTQKQPTRSPSGRRAHGMAYDSARNVTVLFGGAGPRNTSYNDTWEWNGRNWTQRKPTTTPRARFVGMMAYDAARKVVVLFGGTTNNRLSGILNDTWEYDGNNWTLRNPATKPPARLGHAVAYDALRQRTVVFGGVDANGFMLNDTWEFNGTNWRLMNPATKPPARYDFNNMVYDTRRMRMVLHAGRSTSGVANDTWEYVDQSLTGNPTTISISNGGTHTFSLNAGANHANRLYWIFGSISGTLPGVTLPSAIGSVAIPLRPDPYTDLTIGLANVGLLSNTRGTLNNAGKQTASLKVPGPNKLPKSVIGLKLYHSYLVYDKQNNFYMASNPVTLTLTQ